MNEKSQGMRDALSTVREVYRSVSKLLLASDPVLDELGLSPYGYQWKAAEEQRFNHTTPDEWAPHRLVRQYFRKKRLDQELFTVGAYLWDPCQEAMREPLCIASFMSVATIHSNDVYWLPLMQAHDATAPADGEVRLLDPTRWSSANSDALKKLAPTQRVLSVALPLVEITSTSALAHRLLKPLVERIAKEFPL